MYTNSISSQPCTNHQFARIQSHLERNVHIPLLRTAETTYMIGISAIAILGSSLVVATVVNFAAALWFGLPLVVLGLTVITLDDRLEQLERLSRRKSVVEIKPPAVPVVSPSVVPNGTTRVNASATHSG